MKKSLFAASALVAAAAFASGAAHAQTNPNRTPPFNPLAPFGNRPGAIPLVGSGQYVIRGGQIVPVAPVTVTAPVSTTTSSPYYGGYGYGGNTTVIINNGYPNGYVGYNTGYNNGYNGYNDGYNNYNNYNNGVSTVTTGGIGTLNGYVNSYNTGINRRNRQVISGPRSSPVVVVPGVPVTQTVRTGNLTSVTLFNGYAPVWSSGQTVLSPFGSFYGSPAYIESQYVIATPYPYLSGRETTVLNGITVLDGNESVYSSNAPQNARQTPSEGTNEATSDAVAGRKAVLLRDALVDVQAFWVKEDVRALRRRLLPTGTVGVFQNEKFAYSLKRADFLAVSSDALDRVQTQSLKFKRVVARNDGLVNAYAAHTYRLRGINSPTDTGLRAATVRVTFVWDNNDWFVSAISFAPGSLAR